MGGVGAHAFSRSSEVHLCRCRPIMKMETFRSVFIEQHSRKCSGDLEKDRSSGASLLSGYVAFTNLRSRTGQLARFVVFGSFVTAKPEPNDVDIVLLMEDAFDLATLTGETALVFHHMDADAHFGASVFWTRRSGAMGGEQAMIEHWQIRRDGGRRGIVEIVRESIMIADDQQLQTTLERIAWFQQQVAHLRKTETNPVNYRAAVSGFLAEIDRMQLEVREYLSVLPSMV